MMKWLFIFIFYNLFFSPNSFAEMLTFTYVSQNNRCTVLTKEVLGTHKLRLMDHYCASSNSNSNDIGPLIQYEFQRDQVVAYLETESESEKFVLNYGDRLELNGEKLILLNRDQVYQHGSKLTARNDEYVDFCNGDFQILDKHEICLDGNKQIWGTLNQSEYYQILYFDLKKYTHTLIDVLYPLDFSKNRDQLFSVIFSEILSLQKGPKSLMYKLQLLIEHHLIKTQYSIKKYHYFKGLKDELLIQEKYFHDLLNLIFARQCGPNRA